MPRYEREGEAPPAPEPLRTPTVDAHCHLDLMGVEDTLDEALALSASVGVPRVVTIGIDVETSRLAADQADAHPGILAAAAIHPNSAGEATDEALRAIEALAARDRVRAIGETGLDYYRDTADVADQQRSFRAHIAIAKKTGTALVIHDRDAHDDVLRVLDEEGAPERTVFHCFSGDAEMARRCADAGYVMSFAGNITFKNAAHLREAAALAPLELLLVETDAPFLTPMPYRGRPNAPYLIPLTVRALAEVKGLDEDTVAAAVDANARRVFGEW
ncbi:MAG TPA: TatD family hydrolase [Frankiaceae bacterium]|nr:TatD family hydrolase [Frankiaceae bacterium]